MVAHRLLPSEQIDRYDYDVHPDTTSVRGLREYLSMLRRRRWMIAASIVAVVGAALTAALLQDPIYEAQAELLLQPRNAETLFDPQTGARTDAVRAVQTEIEVLKSRPVRDAVRAKIQTEPPQVVATQVGQTDVIDVRARGSEPTLAAAVANAYAEAYVSFRLTQAVNDVVEAVEQIQGKITELQAQIDEIDRRVSGLSATQRIGLEANLRSQQATLVAQQAAFKQKLDELEVERSLKSGGAQLVSRAAIPDQPVEPRPFRTSVLALFLGTALGVGTALLFEHLDDSIKSKEDVDRIVGTAPVLTMVPAITSWKEREQPQVISQTDPTSAAAEAYRSLRTSIQFLALDRPMRTLQITSPNASEGKTTTLANLAIALARAGQRVIVVCCDLRRPRIHDFYSLTNDVGFTSVLLGERSLADAIQSVPGEERVKLLASGPAPPNPSELLGGRRAVELLTALQAESDIVLLDSPPVLPVTDAAVLSSRVDATLLVSTAGTTTRKELQRAYELLKQVDAPLIGTVLNGVSADSSYGYAYQYKYYVKDEPERKKGSRRERSGAAGSTPRV